MSGWIKIHRRITEWEWYSDANTFRLFMHLLLTANYEDKRWRNINVKRGQLVTGRQELAQALRLTERQIRTSLDKLKMSGVITTQTTNQYSLITIGKYDLFQEKPVENVQRKVQPTTSNMSDKSPTKSQTRVQVIATTQEKKNSLKNKISSFQSDILSKEQSQNSGKSFAELLKSKGIE